MNRTIRLLGISFCRGRSIGGIRCWRGRSGMIVWDGVGKVELSHGDVAG